MFLSTNINACLADNAKPNGKNKKEGEKGKYFGLLFLILGNAWLLCPSSGFFNVLSSLLLLRLFLCDTGKKHLGSKKKWQRQCHLFIARGGKTLFSSRCNCNVGLYFSSFKSCQKNAYLQARVLVFPFFAEEAAFMEKRLTAKRYGKVKTEDDASSTFFLHKSLMLI